MTKKFTKALLIAVCALTLVATTFAGTLAYLTDSDEISNTFTAGNVSITLTETNGADSYKLIPGKKYDKDPTVTVLQGSEKCYLFVKVENTISGIEADTDDIKTIAEQMDDNGWRQLKVNGIDVANVYYHEDVVNASASNVERDVFSTFTIDGGVEAEDFTDIGAQFITVTAYAVQYEGFETSAADAWKATFGA